MISNEEKGGRGRAGKQVRSRTEQSGIRNRRRVERSLRMPMSIKDLANGLPLDPLPPLRPLSTEVGHAPKRQCPLSFGEKKIALANALRYFPSHLHETLAKEFAQELETYGHIYMYRWVPDFEIKAHPIDEYPARNRQSAAIMLMIMNNLDARVAQFPQELVTYGGNGQVFSNWAQFWLVMHYLSTMSDEQTLVMYSGHPMGLFPSHKNAPRVVITNGMMIPSYSSKELYDKFFAQGVTMYGQMTAGSYCYIGPQGIVHGTTITVMNAGRKYLGVNDLRGKVFVTSGLGGMSGAQAKAAVIAGCIGVIAEVSETALKKRHDQGWLMEWSDNLDQIMARIRRARQEKTPLSLGYLGNVVDLWERFAKELDQTGELLVELGSDQTSCHNPFNGGYYPAQLTFSEANKMMADRPEKFRELVQESLRRHLDAIDRLAKGGMHFWDYGNAFLLECRRAGADVDPPGVEQASTDSIRFKYPSYVQDIMGDVFSLGFGPFRWVCCSGDEHDLETTDRIARETLERLARAARKARITTIVESQPMIVVLFSASDEVANQYADNIRWIIEAPEHRLVVGSQARILYCDERGRSEVSVAFNKAVGDGRLRAPVVISRDHHDVSGTDSPFRETSNIEDGSAFTADMAVQNFVGDSFRGATWVSLHNGGGVGWGEVINGGFGLLLDGTNEAAARAQSMLHWDVCNGVARRCWSGNPLARRAIQESMKTNPSLNVFLPNPVENDGVLVKALHSSI